MFFSFDKQNRIYKNRVLPIYRISFVLYFCRSKTGYGNSGRTVPGNGEERWTNRAGRAGVRVRQIFRKIGVNVRLPKSTGQCGRWTDFAGSHRATRYTKIRLTVFFKILERKIYEKPMSVHNVYVVFTFPFLMLFKILLKNSHGP